MSHVDEILRGVVGLYETVFPQCIRGYYLIGSYTGEHVVPLSDIDLGIIFREPWTDAENVRARQIGGYCSMLSPIRLDILTIGESALGTLHGVQQLAIKLGSLLLYGEDVRAQIALPPPDPYTRDVAAGALYFLIKVLRESQSAQFPLAYPEPDGEFFGYDRKRIAAWYPDSIRHGLKEWVATVSRLATATIALKCGRYVPGKGEAVRLYRECVDDAWSSYVESVYHYGKLQWQYLVPEPESERALLRSLCEQTLAFENQYLEQYRVYLLSLLHSGDDEAVLHAVHQLQQIVFTDEEVVVALQQAEGRHRQK